MTATRTNGRAASTLAAGLMICAVVEVAAIYVRQDAKAVPVARLVANLERSLAANPKSPDIHIKLARLYGMAYAVNSDEVPAVPTPAGEEVWFGHEPALVPHQAKPQPPGTRTDASRKYLQKSMEHYRDALELDPENLLARLGHGWTAQQAGDIPTAIAEYRRVIARAWQKEQAARSVGLGERFYTQEAAGYLIPLLDPKRDAAEIAELKGHVSRLDRLPRPITPIAIPLTDSATRRSIVDLDAKVMFDADGSGRRRQWTWISREAGWLIYDAANQRTISSALQWFGNVTFWLFWNNGYEALAALDDDGDSELSGPELRHLAVWHDADGDGASDPGEVRRLADHGIVAISCRYARGDGLLTAAWSAAGVRMAGGRTRASYDVILRPSISVSAPEPAPPPD